jgi:hypothetical protein
MPKKFLKMDITKNKSFGYYFLNKRLHPPFPQGYRVSIVLLIINKNKTENLNNFLIVRQSGGLWGLPKEGVKSKIAVEDIYTTIARNLELEIGFKGLKVIDTNPQFKQVGLLFNFDKQKYDSTRSSDELTKGRPIKGKIYILSMMEFAGNDKLPLKPNAEVIDYRWINEDEWASYESQNIEISKLNNKSENTAYFSGYILNKSIKTYRLLQKLYLDKDPGQASLF